jgi:hypothetical protein
MSGKSGLRLDLLGVAIGGGLATWLAVAGLVSGGDPAPASALVLAAATATVVSRRWSSGHPLLFPATVAALPLLALVMRRSSPLEDGILGYSNSSAALYFIAACGAVAAGLAVRRPIWRGAWYLVAVTWALLPWKIGAHAAATLTLALPVAVMAVRSGRGARRVVLVGAVAAAAGLVAATAMGLSHYRPGSGTTAFDRWFDDTLSELRVVYWGESIDLALRHPLTGVGPGGFHEASPTAVERDDRSWSHNEYLQVAAESGIPGGLLLLGLVGWSFLYLWRSCKSPSCVPAAVALGGAALHANIDFIWHFPEVPMALAMLVGAGAARTEAPSALPAGTSRGLPDPARVAVVATAALWLSLLAPVEPINPASSTQNGAVHLSEANAVRFASPGMIRTTAPPSDLYQRVMETGELTLEAWVSSSSPDQGGPARIISASSGIATRNFTLGQQGGALVFRLRTTRTNPNGSDAQLEVPDVFAAEGLQHIVITTTLDGTRLYVDGAVRHVGNGPGGSVSNWDRDYPLVFGNEATGHRPWLGTMHSAAIYGAAISEAAVRYRYAAGPGAGVSDHPELGSLLVAYSLGEDSGASFPGQGRGPFAVPLAVPERVPSARRGFVETLTDADGSATVRLLSHAGLLGIWALMILRAAPLTRGPRFHRTKMAVLFGGMVVLLASTAIRYLEARAPSAWDVAGGFLGLALVMLTTVPRSRKEQPEPD